MTPAERLALFTTPTKVLGAAKDQSAAGAWVTSGRGAQWTKTGVAPRLCLAVKDWSWPEHRATLSTPERRVWRAPAVWGYDGHFPTAGSPTRGRPAVIPWDPSWRTATAEDAGVLIDCGDGTGVEALGLRPPWPWEAFQIAWATAVDGDPGQFQDGDLIAGALAIRTPANAGRYVGRGCGDVPKRVGIVTADEILSGDIGHAMAMTGLTQWGAAQGARFVAPATRVEHSERAPSGYPKALTAGNNPRVVPAGTRLAIAMTDTEIAARVKRRAFTGALARTATTLVRGLRDWGVIHGAETGVGDPQIECTGLLSDDASTWRALGITEQNAVTILDGLPWTRLYVVGNEP